MNRTEVPALGKDSFDCPFCDVRSNQVWFYAGLGHKFYDEAISIHSSCDGLSFSVCQNRSCGKQALWCREKLVYPKVLLAPFPHQEMPEEVGVLYEEARNIANDSPRAAAALLRTAMEELLNNDEFEGKNLNEKIKKLLLPEEMKGLFHTVRLVGNNALHRGTIDLTQELDSTSIVNGLFELLNYITEVVIAGPRRMMGISSGIQDVLSKESN